MSLIKKIGSFPLIALILFFSCQNDAGKGADNALEAIPINSTVVTAFDVPTLMQKANFEAIQKMDFYRFFMEKAEEESDILATVLANPENAGIDLTKNAYVSIELNPDNPEEIYTGIIFNLVSPEDFSSFANSFRDAKTGKRNGYQFADLNDDTQLAWNNRVGILALGEGIYETEEVVDAFFAPSQATSLSKDENLTQLLSEQHDVTTWLTSNALAKNKNAKLVLSLAKIKPEAIHDNFIHGHVDFETGKVNTQLNYFFQEALIEDVNLLFKEHVKTDFSPYVDGKNLNIYLSAALDFAGLHTALSKRPQVKMFADFALKSYGLSINKLKAALDGDFVFATYTGNVNNRQEGLFAIKLNDQSQFEAFLTIAEANDLVTKTGNGRYNIAPSLNKMLGSILPFEMDLGSAFDNQLMIKDGIAFIAGNIDRLDNIASGNIKNTKQLPVEINKMVNANPLALFIDFNSLKRVGILNTASLNLLELFGNKKGADFELSMQNQNINSLQAIFEAINEAFLETKEEKQPVSQEKS
ncbi:MAG: DUF4836 family protein [Saprospiraceae bacterium]